MPWAPDYITVPELRAYDRVNDDLDDPQLADAIVGASRAVDRECLRQFGKVDASESRTYRPRWSKSRGGWIVAIDDVMTSAGLVVALDTALDGTFATPITKYALRPSNANAVGKPWEALLLSIPSAFRVQGLVDEVRVTANPFGWTAVPQTIKLATKMQGQRFATRRDSPYGIAGTPENGSELRLLARVDPDVAVMLNGYRRRVKVR